MFSRIVAFIVVALSGSQAARTSFRATLQSSEFAHLQVLIANTTKALKESQAASAVEKKAPEEAKKAPVAEKKEAPAAQKKAPEAVKAPVAEKKTEAPKAQKPKPAFPQHATKEHQAMIIKQLAAEEDLLSKNLKEIKAEQKKDKLEAGNEKHLESMMKGKDADMLKNFDIFSKRANAKAAVGAQDVLSKLKHMIHFIKKGALSGDDKAANGLNDVLKDMSGMVR